MFILSFCTYFRWLKTTQGIVKQSQTGPATVIIEGMAVGMFSTWLPVIVIAGGIIAASKTHAALQ